MLKPLKGYTLVNLEAVIASGFDFYATHDVRGGIKHHKIWPTTTLGHVSGVFQ